MILVLLLSSVVFGDDRREDRSRLVVMSFNAEFMWDGLLPEEGSAYFPWKGNPPEARNQHRGHRQGDPRQQSDSLQLLEVENINAVRLLNDEYLKGCGYVVYLNDSKDTSTGQDIGLLTRVDPEKDGIFRDERKGRRGTVSKSVTKHYIARFCINDRPIAIVGAHLLARPNDWRRSEAREAQADAVRAIALDQAKAGYKLIVMGDFNDYEDEPQYQDHLVHTPITRVLAIMRTLDPECRQDDLVNSAHHVPPVERYTAYWDINEDGEIDAPQEFSQIDHILLSPTLDRHVVKVDIPHHHDPGWSAITSP